MNSSSLSAMALVLALKVRNPGISTPGIQKGLIFGDGCQRLGGKYKILMVAQMQTLKAMLFVV